MLIQNTPIPLQAAGVPLIAFMPAEDGSSITQITINAYGTDGSSLLKVENNEWRVESDLFDFEWVGQRFFFRERSMPVLVLRLEPPHFIAIELFKTKIRGMLLDVNEERLVIGGAKFRDCIASGCHIGFSL